MIRFLQLFFLCVLEPGQIFTMFLDLQAVSLIFWPLPIKPICSFFCKYTMQIISILRLKKSNVCMSIFPHILQLLPTFLRILRPQNPHWGKMAMCRHNDVRSPTTLRQEQLSNIRERMHPICPHIWDLLVLWDLCEGKSGVCHHLVGNTSDMQLEPCC